MDRILLILILGTCQSFPAYSQIEFEARSNRTKIGINESVEVGFFVYTEDREVFHKIDKDSVTYPDFDGFEAPDRFPQGERTHTSYGSKASKEYTFHFQLKPARRGKLTIGSASIIVDGKEYSTKPLKVKVGKPVDLHDAFLVDIDTEIHLVAELGNDAPLLDEPILLKYDICFKEGLLFKGTPDVKEEATYGGLQKVKITIADHEPFKKMHAKEDYLCYTTKALYLVPQEAVPFTVEPMTMEVPISVPSKHKDLFEKTIYHTVTKTLTSNAITLDAKALPDEARSYEGPGSTGYYRMRIEPSRTELARNDTFEIQVKAFTSGDLLAYDLPELQTPEGLEVIKIEKRPPVMLIDQQAFGKMYTYIVLAREAGDHEVSLSELKYVDLEDGVPGSLEFEKVVIKVRE